MTFAKVVISAVVASPAEKRFTPNNVAVANFEVTVTPAPRFNGQVDDPYNIKVTCWTKLAEAVSTQLNVGDQVLLEGKLMMNSFQTAEGVQKKSFEIEASSVNKLSGTLEVVSLDTVEGGQAPAYSQEAQASAAPAPATVATATPASAPLPAAPAGSLPSGDSLTEDDIPF